MVLLDAMHRIQRRASGKNVLNSPPALEFTALHVHHGLSPNADAWAAFCQHECDQRGVSLVVAQVTVDRSNTGGQGIEGAARAARYEAFQAHGAPTILAAQHADDQAETVLHQLLRGTGLAGLAAMGEARTMASGQCLLRPLLQISRRDIEHYAAQHQVKWIKDESNDDTTYTRNFIRHDLMPLIVERFPHASAALSRAARHAAESAEMLEALAKLDLQWDGASAAADALDALPIARQTNALYYWLKWQGVVAPSHAQLESWAAQLFRDSPTDKPHQAGGHDFIIRRRGGRLELIRR
jgi:tRNA(Ile)-lysidine synthase